MLDAGKDIFIEKPIVLKEADLDQLQKKAQEKELIIMEGHLLLYHSAVRRFKKALDDNEIGKVNHIYFKRTALGAIRFESSALWDFAPHDLSVLMYLIPDMPETVYSSGLKVFEKSGGEEIVFTTLKYSDKVASIHESWLDPAKDRKIVAVGEKAMLMLDELADDGKIKLFAKKVELNSEAKFEHDIFNYLDEGFKVLDYPDSEPLKEECQHFIDCITDRKTPVSNVENSKKVLRMLLQADSSLQDGTVKKI
jgi:predicted dehydrogenase